jgi:hypothetical protein
MSNSRKPVVKSSRRTFLKAAAGVTAGTVLTPRSLWAQESASRAARAGLDRQLMITPAQALEWHKFKAECGPTYAGSAGWKRFNDYVVARIPQMGGVDLDHVDITYDHYIVDDWPDRRAHLYNSGVAVEKLVTDGTPVPVVASYGMTSGFTPKDGITAKLLFYDRANPPSAADMAGKILVFQTAPYPSPPYSNSFLDNYTMTDYEWRSPGKWSPLYSPVPTTVSTSYHTRWVWSQLGGFASTALKAKAAGVVVVYDLSPGAAFGLTQRSVYTENAKAGHGATYINCPTLALDRVNGAKVLADAKAGKSATLTLTARFQRDTGRATVAYLPGKDYGTPRDQQVMVATHTDAMSLIEENGAFGLLGIMSYFNKLPRASRPRTLALLFDCRHFMPGGEDSWEEYDYFKMHPERLKSIVGTIGVEHMGGRQTVETGTDNNQYTYSKERPEDGGVITSLIDVHNNNIWLVETVARAATANAWPRVDVKSGTGQPGVNGGFQGSVKSPMNRGRTFKLPGIGLAGDWPGAWTQTYSQVDTEAGPAGFDENYFVKQVAGLTQVAGDMMRVDPKVIDLAWGEAKSAIVNLKDEAFAAAATAKTAKQALVEQYTGAFRQSEAGTHDKAISSLASLSNSAASQLSPEARTAIAGKIDALRAKLA